MILIEKTGVPPASWPIMELREHLRLGKGFADDASQDALLERLLRSAAAVIERRTGKALLQRTFVLTLSAWRGVVREELPRVPAVALSAVRIIDSQSTVSTIPLMRFTIDADAHRPKLHAVSGGLPTIPVGGKAEIEFDAGYAADWSGVPSDLALAVMMLAAHFHENRHAVADSGAPIPYGIESMIEGFRPIRLFGRSF